MGAVQFENILLALFPVVFGFIPAVLDAVGIKRKPPNLVVSLMIAVLVAISSLAWMPSKLDNLVAVVGLIVIPAVFIAYGVSRLIIWLLLSAVRAVAGR